MYRHLLGCAVTAGALLLTMPAGAELRVAERDGAIVLTNVPPRQVPGPAAPATIAGPVAGASLRHVALIQEIASRYGLPPSLVEAVVRVESNFNPWAVSPKGALGLRDVFDVRENIDGGVRHLRALLAGFAGDLRLALAAYNAGEEAVRRYRGVPPYPETQSYVVRVLRLVGWLPQAPLIPAPPVVAAPPRLDHHEASDGTVIYTNLPPSRLPARTRAMLERAEALQALREGSPGAR